MSEKRYAHESIPVGQSADDQARNAILLSGYDYGKYIEALTGFAGQDQQRISLVRSQHAIRTRIGPVGNYKGTMVRCPDGRLVVATCRHNCDPEPGRRKYNMFVYESTDIGQSWQEIGQTPIPGKEPTMALCLDGSMVLLTESQNPVKSIYRSQDGGRIWEQGSIEGVDTTRNIIVEKDGSLLRITAERPGWITNTQDSRYSQNASSNLLLSRSTDSGKTWTYEIGKIDWDETWFGEVCGIRLADGLLLAALRRQMPGTRGEAYEDSVITKSVDNGKTWSKPWPLTTAGQVHAYLTELEDGRLLCTYSNYHVPYGSSVIISQDGGKTWDLENTICLALSNDYYTGWAGTLQLPDKSLATVYAITSHREQDPETTSTGFVHWDLP